MRKETSLHVTIGNLYLQESLLDVAISKMTVQVDETVADCNQTFQFHSEHPFIESICFAVDLSKPEVTLRLSLIDESTGDAVGYARVLVPMDSELQDERMTLQLLKPLVQFQNLEGIADLVSHEEKQIGTIEIKLSIMDNDLAPLLYPDHPLSQHLGGRESGRDRRCLTHAEWSAVRIPQLHACEGIETQGCETWQVPSPQGAAPVLLCVQCDCTAVAATQRCRACAVLTLLLLLWGLLLWPIIVALLLLVDVALRFIDLLCDWRC